MALPKHAQYKSDDPHLVAKRKHVEESLKAVRQQVKCVAYRIDEAEMSKFILSDLEIENNTNPNNDDNHVNTNRGARGENSFMMKASSSLNDTLTWTPTSVADKYVRFQNSSGNKLKTNSPLPATVIKRSTKSQGGCSNINTDCSPSPAGNACMNSKLGSTRNCKLVRKDTESMSSTASTEEHTLDSSFICALSFASSDVGVDENRRYNGYGTNVYEQDSNVNISSFPNALGSQRRSAKKKKYFSLPFRRNNYRDLGDCSDEEDY